MLKKNYLVLIGALFLLCLVMISGKDSQNAQSTNLPSLESALTAAGVAGTIEIALEDGVSVTHPDREDVERGFLNVTLPTGLDKVHLDVAELVFTVSSDYDPSEPLLIAVAPATVSNASSSLAAEDDWDDADDALDAEYLMVAPMNATEGAVEVRIDVTHIVERWLSGEATNHGLVLKSIGEDKSTFSWIKDGRYDGGDAKLIVLFSKV